jgi:hypothetical protein
MFEVIWETVSIENGGGVFMHLLTRLPEKIRRSTPLGLRIRKYLFRMHLRSGVVGVSKTPAFTMPWIRLKWAVRKGGGGMYVMSRGTLP